MRLVKLAVDRFQCIDHAELEFGPGLNVLYGPNDLGKSSLAWAIRAVLLLQHSSAHHERFVSWYGDAPPSVELSFASHDDRHWRVTKAFGGSSGRSLLETSKDGRSFSTDANGRQVDEKLRKLLGWGIAAPGGVGAGRGFPDSFLTQVLLSEQDNVRKVLFDTSLTKDSDESGRQRLTEALGALAQDPLFKAVLDDAQAYVDQAFTKTGRKKRAAGSPFLEVTERIKSLQREADALEAQVRETVLAEQRVSTLIRERDRLARELEDARGSLARMQAAFATAIRRRELRDQISAHEVRIGEVESLRASIREGEQQHGEMQVRAAASAAALQALGPEVASLAAALEAARAQQQAVLLDPGYERARTDGEQKLADARHGLLTAGHDLERSREREAAARQAAQAVAEALVALARREAEASSAERAHLDARAEATRAQEALERAKVDLREATSSDRAQARELRRRELENQRLAREADLRTVQATQQQLDDFTDGERRLQAAQALRDQHQGQVTRLAAVADETQEALRQNEGRERSLRSLQALGQLRVARKALADAEAANRQVVNERARGASLRDEAAALRSQMRAGLPTPARAAELRRLAEDVRVAEARLGGGLSVVVRPRRALQVRATIDDAAATTTQTAEPIFLNAVRSASLAIEDVVEIELTAGEESARARARELRARWAAEGEQALRALGLASLDELDQEVAAGDAAARRAAELEREALGIEQRLSQTPPADTAEVLARVQELEAALVNADQVALTEELDRLGSKWARELQDKLARCVEERTALKGALDEAREQLVRSSAQLEGAAQALASEREGHARKVAALAGDPGALAATTAARLRDLQHELAEVAAQLALLGGEEREASVLRERVQAAERTLEAAKVVASARENEVRTAREAVVQCRATRDGALMRARELDDGGAWEAALAAGAALDILPWTEATARAQRVQAERTRTIRQLEADTQVLAKHRQEAIEAAQTTLRSAEHRSSQGQQRLAAAQEAQQGLEREINAKLLAIAGLKTTLAGLNVDVAVAELARLRGELATLPGDDSVDEERLDRVRRTVNERAAQHHECVEELAKARGALEQVGGAMVREQKRELDEAIKREMAREHEIEVEYDAWKLLVDTLRETESQEGAHLGRALAGPVSERFRELTRGRYGNLELGAHLEGTGLEVQGEARDFSVLSAGTQDQLATLLRLCVAEQLRTAIVLDDHLSQSDPARVAWFNSVLRAAAHQIQIVFVTCRPMELLTEAELPGPGEATKISAAGHVRATDLTKVIRRFASDPNAPEGGVPSIPGGGSERRGRASKRTAEP